MPITVKHDVTGGLVGAYASGQGAARQRTQKYALNNLLLQQRHQQRLREIAAMRGGRGRAAQPAGQWMDPLAADPFQQGANPLMTESERRAAIRRRDRQRRLGRASDSEPTFIPQEQIEAEREQRNRLAIMEAQQGFLDRRAATQMRQAQRVARAENLSDIPDHLSTTHPGLHRELTTKQSAIEQMVHDPKWDWDAPDGSAQEQLDKAIEEYENAIANLPERDLNRGGVVLDPAEGFRFVRPGEVPTHWDMGPGQPPVATDEYKAEREKQEADAAAQAKIDEKLAKEEEARRKQVESELRDLKKERRALKGNRASKPSPEVLSELDDEIARLESQLQPVTEDTSVPPPAPAGSVAPPAPAPVAPAEPPTPTGEQPVETAPFEDIETQAPKSFKALTENLQSAGVAKFPNPGLTSNLFKNPDILNSFDFEKLNHIEQGYVAQRIYNSLKRLMGEHVSRDKMPTETQALFDSLHSARERLRNVYRGI